MRRSILFAMIIFLGVLAAPQMASAAKVGQAAPDFTATGSNGKTYHLADFRGKFVVLEWHNNGCPYTPEALSKREHAATSETVDGERRRLVHCNFLRAGEAGLRDGESGKRLHVEDAGCPNRRSS